MANAGSETPQSARVMAALLLGAIVLACAMSAADGAWSLARAPFPFQWRDVALAHLLSALPFAGFLAAFLRERVSLAGAVAVAFLVFVGSLVSMLDVGRAQLVSVVQSSVFMGVALRAALGLAGALALVMCGMALLGAGRAGNAPADGRAPVVAFVVSALFLVLAPWTYVAARCRHDLVKLDESLEEMRFGDAQLLAHRLLVLDGSTTLQGRPLAAVVDDIDRTVRDLEALAQRPLGADAPSALKLERARQLAMLGRTEAALEVLKSVPDVTAARHAETLRGTIHESREEWAAALEAYQRARTAWEAEPESSARTAGVVRAATGAAYSQRKMGRYAEAEATYLEVLALAPTADSHFLLAQFYEDAQQADQARAHARSAIALAPDRFRSAGERLVGKLATSHFGCLGVFVAERSTR